MNRERRTGGGNYTQAARRNRDEDRDGDRNRRQRQADYSDDRRRRNNHKQYSDSEDEDYGNVRSRNGYTRNTNRNQNRNNRNSDQNRRGVRFEDDSESSYDEDYRADKNRDDRNSDRNRGDQGRGYGNSSSNYNRGSNNNDRYNYRSGDRRVEGTEADQRHQYNPRDHPRDADGHFITKTDAMRQGMDVNDYKTDRHYNDRDGNYNNRSGNYNNQRSNDNYRSQNDNYRGQGNNSGNNYYRNNSDRQGLVEGTEADERHHPDPKDHPRNESGQFITKTEAMEEGQDVNDYKDDRNHKDNTSGNYNNRGGNYDSRAGNYDSNRRNNYNDGRSGNYNNQRESQNYNNRDGNYRNQNNSGNYRSEGGNYQGQRNNYQGQGGYSQNRDGYNRGVEGTDQDRRHDYNPMDHPRDAQGHLITKEQAMREGIPTNPYKTEDRNDNKEQSGTQGLTLHPETDGRKNPDPKDHPRGENGQLISKQQAMAEGQDVNPPKTGPDAEKKNENVDDSKQDGEEEEEFDGKKSIDKKSQKNRRGTHKK